MLSKKILKYQIIGDEMHSKKTLISIFLASFLTGCGGGGSEGNSNGSESTPALKVGYFKDSSVEGVEYKTDTQSGLTEHGGSFNYYSGETVNFSIGSLKIGEAKAAPVITPMEMTSFLSPADTENVNIVRVLMSLDTDGDADNGIQIAEAVREYLNEIDASQVDIKTQAGFDDFEDEIKQLLPSISIPSSEDAITHFNETVRCNLSGVFYGDYKGDGDGIFVVAIDPKTLTPKGAFKPNDGYEYEWFGLSGNALELKGGAQPVALGRSEVNDDYAGVTFAAIFEGHDLSGLWSQNEEGGGAIEGEKFISNYNKDQIKYVGTYRVTESEQISGVMQVIISSEDLMSVDWYDFSNNKQYHSGTAFNDGNVWINLDDREISADQNIEFVVERNPNHELNKMLIDSQGNEIELVLSSCRV